MMTNQMRWLGQGVAWLSLLLLAGCVSQNTLTDATATRTDGGGEYILLTLTNDGQQEKQLFKGFSRNYQAPKQYAGTLAVKQTVDALIRDYGLQSGPGWQINTLKIYCVMVQIPATKSADAVIASLQRDARVETVQRVVDYAVQGRGDAALKQRGEEGDTGTGYNDPYFSVQYKRQADTIAQLHRQGTGQGVNIAVIDTGVDVTHPDLKRQIRRTRNFVDNNRRQFTTDIHGTAVAGIIAARPGNAFGIVGLAPGAEVAALKACWQLSEQSSIARCNSFTLASALSDAIDHRVDIINVSLSGPQDPLVARLIQAAIAQDILVVASDPVAGKHRYPAQLPGVIKVKDTRWQASANQMPVDKLTVFINGNDVLTTGPGGHFDFFSGSSMSAAMISGLSALVLEQNPQLDAEAVLHKLKETIIAEPSTLGIHL